MPITPIYEEEDLFVPPFEDIALEMCTVLESQYKKDGVVDIDATVKEILEVFPGLKATGGEKMGPNHGIRIVTEEVTPESGSLNSDHHQSDTAAAVTKPRRSGGRAARRSQPPPSCEESKAPAAIQSEDQVVTAQEGNMSFQEIMEKSRSAAALVHNISEEINKEATEANLKAARELAAVTDSTLSWLPRMTTKAARVPYLGTVVESVKIAADVGGLISLGKTAVEGYRYFFGPKLG